MVCSAQYRQQEYELLATVAVGTVHCSDLFGAKPELRGTGLHRAQGNLVDH